MTNSKSAPEKTSMRDIFFALEGKMAWNVSRGIGTYMTLEFGNPHLEVREPVNRLGATSQKVRSALAHRKVSVVGEWHLWIRDVAWTITNSDFQEISENADDESILQALHFLDGQIVTSVSSISKSGVLTVGFDLGTTVNFVVSGENEPVMAGLYGPDKLYIEARIL